MRTINWRYIVEFWDRRSGVVAREVFMFRPDADHRFGQLRAAGFFAVRLYRRRNRAHGFPSTQKAGIQPGRYTSQPWT